MFENIGGKIKYLTKILFWIGVGLSAVVTLGLFISAANVSRRFVATYVITGFAVLIFGPLGSWCSSLLLYGFGELIERAKSIDDKLAIQNTLLNKQNSVASAAPVKPAQTKPKEQPRSLPQPPVTEKAPVVKKAPAVEKAPAEPTPVAEAPAAKIESAPLDAYDDAELLILKALVKEGKLSREEYQNCLSSMKK